MLSVRLIVDKVSGMKVALHRQVRLEEVLKARAVVPDLLLS